MSAASDQVESLVFDDIFELCFENEGCTFLFRSREESLSSVSGAGSLHLFPIGTSSSELWLSTTHVYKTPYGDNHWNVKAKKEEELRCFQTVQVDKCPSIPYSESDVHQQYTSTSRPCQLHNSPWTVPQWRQKSSSYDQTTAPC